MGCSKFHFLFANDFKYILYQFAPIPGSDQMCIQWHHSTYAAFCRHYGTHKTANQLYRCWNDEILQEAREELQPKWDGIVDWIQEQTAVLREATANAFQSVCKLLHGETC